MITGLGQKIVTDSVPTHDFRDPSTWPAFDDSSWELGAPDGYAYVLSTIWVKISNNADMASPLIVDFKDRDGELIRSTEYASLDDFMDRFTSYREVEPSRYENPIEIHEYEFPQPIVLRSAASEEGTPLPNRNVASMTLRIESNSPYKAIGGGDLEFCRVRFPDVTMYVDEEFSP